MPQRSTHTDQWLLALKKAGLWLSGEVSAEIDFISSDSRQFKADKNDACSAAFFARRGFSFDGHKFLHELQDNDQIKVFFVEEIPSGFESKTPVVRVKDSSEAMSCVAKLFYGDPTLEQFCVGVTGTNGKTTSCFLVQKILEALGKKCAVSGTIGTFFGDYEEEATLTTPDFSELQKKFMELSSKGAEAIAFEASSHALDQGRIRGIELDAAIFTNLSPEHLDYHQSMEEYYVAKRKLFSQCLPSSKKARKIAIVSEATSFGVKLVEDLRAITGIELWSWGEKEKKNDRYLQLSGLDSKLSGCTAVLRYREKDYELFSPLIGKHNIENIVGALCLGLAMGEELDQLIPVFKDFTGVPGRLERVGDRAFVDYAHTPDALENVLMTLRPLTKGKLKLVFGCGGDRDREKRPKMGEISELYADEIFVTSDNPRTENPDQIIQQILKGMQRVKKIVVEADRKKAILSAAESLDSDDVLLVAGKGHETYQILGKKRLEFDDREVLQSYFTG